MKRVVVIFCGVVAALSTVVVMSASAAAQGQGRGGGGGRGAAPACMNLACDVQADWARSAQLLIAIADAMPEDKWTFKATPPQRSFGEQVMHVVPVDQRLLGALGAKAPAPQINLKATSKADVMAALRQSMEHGTAVIKEFDDQGLLERVPGQFLGASASRVRLINFAMAHGQDIYGQMAVYLRLNGVVPPASNRP
jgi:uncharacterized damage-inducible protein DinB